MSSPLATPAAQWRSSPPLDLFQAGLNFVQMADGLTPNSITAFNTVCDLMHTKDDHLTLVHLRPPTDPIDVSTALVQHFETKLLARFSRKRFTVRSMELNTAVPLRSAVLGEVRALSADLCILGYRGLKGGITTVMGSAEDLSLREGHTSALFVKSWEEVAGAAGEKVVLVAVDGSTRSQQALLLALRLARPGRDKVRAVYVETVGVVGDREGDAVQTGFAALTAPAKAAGIDLALVRKSIGGFKNPAEVILALIDELSASMVVVGADGLGASMQEKKQGLGSVSDHVLRKASCDVLLFHEPRHTQNAPEAGTEPNPQHSASTGGGGGGAGGPPPKGSVPTLPK